VRLTFYAMKRRHGIRIKGHHEHESCVRVPGSRIGPTGSIVVSFSSSPRAKAGRSDYHELGDNFEPREDVRKIRDMGMDGWQQPISVGLYPSHDCRLGDLVYAIVDRLEQTRGETVHFAAFAHRDTDHPHAHLIIRGDGLSERELRDLERDIEAAATAAYADIRQQQREYAREREQVRAQGRDLEP
jgi:hypothetical protein